MGLAGDRAMIWFEIPQTSNLCSFEGSLLSRVNRGLDVSGHLDDDPK